VGLVEISCVGLEFTPEWPLSLCREMLHGDISLRGRSHEARPGVQRLCENRSILFARSIAEVVHLKGRRVRSWEEQREEWNVLCIHCTSPRACRIAHGNPEADLSRRTLCLAGQRLACRSWYRDSTREQTTAE
jgi:hypothetical protein